MIENSEDPVESEINKSLRIMVSNVTEVTKLEGGYSEISFLSVYGEEMVLRFRTGEVEK